jgi:hypothetical protein
MRSSSRRREGRFVNIKSEKPEQKPRFDYAEANGDYYRIPRPGLLWNGYHGETLPEDGGKIHRPRKKHSGVV